MVSDGAWILVVGGVLLVLAALLLHWRSRTTRPDPAVPAPVPGDVAPPKEPEEMISFKRVSEEYCRRKNLLDEHTRRIDMRLAALRDRRIEVLAPETLLESESLQERANLAAIVGVSPNSAPQQVVDAIREAGSHSLAVLTRGALGAEKFVPYRTVLVDVAKKLGVPAPSSVATDASIEQSAVVVAFDRMLSQLPTDKRMALMERLRAEQQKRTTGKVATTGALIAANLSGFGLYTAASSLLAAITSAAGLTLPFAVYTGVSTAIATITGPIGWTALAAWVVVGLGKANYKKTVPAVLAIATLRMRLVAERDQEIDALVTERDGELANQAKSVSVLRALLDRMTAQGLSAIPRSELPGSARL